MQPKLQALATKYPFVTITGPRQSGKSTLAEMAFANYRKVSLEDIDMRMFATADPRGFIKSFPDKIIIDEVQRVPSLLSYLQTHTDNMKQEGMYILTGSQNHVLMQSIDQTLAGRTALLELLPFSQNEIMTTGLQNDNVNDQIFNGCYPRLYAKDIYPTDYYPNYISTYIERDVRNLVNVGDLKKFIKFIKLCAGRIGQLLNKTSIATEAGISVPTVDSWISVLESSYIAYLLQPYHENFSKRLVKTPKLYFYDTGLACSLLDIQSADQLATHFLRGGLFENMVITELFKHYLNLGIKPTLNFWLDAAGNEIDLIDTTFGNFKAYEIKSGATFSKDFFKGLAKWAKLSETQAENMNVIYTGDLSLQTTDGNLITWKEFFSAL